LDWHQLQRESECFFLRIFGVGDYRWKGADLGVLVTKGRLQTEDPEVGEAPAPAPEPQPGEPMALDLISGSESDVPPTGSEDTPAENMSSGNSRLTGRGRRLIQAIRDQYAGVPVAAEFVVPATSVGVKSSS
jgi:hypothetical protein